MWWHIKIWIVLVPNIYIKRTWDFTIFNVQQVRQNLYQNHVPDSCDFFKNSKKCHFCFEFDICGLGWLAGAESCYDWYWKLTRSMSQCWILILSNVLLIQSFGLPTDFCRESGLFWWSPTIHRCISQNKDELCKYDWFWQIAMNWMM